MSAISSHPDRPDKPRSDGPAVLVSPRCPNCGARASGRFSVVATERPPKGDTDRQVCMHC